MSRQRRQEPIVHLDKYLELRTGDNRWVEVPWGEADQGGDRVLNLSEFGECSQCGGHAEDKTGLAIGGARTIAIMFSEMEYRANRPCPSCVFGAIWKWRAFKSSGRDVPWWPDAETVIAEPEPVTDLPF